MHKWYYESNGQQNGPVDEQVIIQLFQTGEISRDSLVWRSGMENWIALGAVPDFVGKIGTQDPATDAPTSPAAPAAPQEVEVSNPYAAPQAAAGFEAQSVHTTELIYASRWARLAAAIIDGVIVFVVAVIGVIIFYGGSLFVNQGFGDFEASYSSRLAENLVSQVIGFVIYFALNGYFLHKDGQTIGKKILGIQIVDYETGRVPSFAVSGLLRYLVPSIINYFCCRQIQSSKE